MARQPLPSNRQTFYLVNSSQCLFAGKGEWHAMQVEQSGVGHAKAGGAATEKGVLRIRATCSTALAHSSEVCICTCGGLERGIPVCKFCSK